MIGSALMYHFDCREYVIEAIRGYTWTLTSRDFVIEWISSFGGDRLCVD